MESNYNFPKSGPFPSGGATASAIELGDMLDNLARQQAFKPTIIGVGLFKLDPGAGSLTRWDPTENKAVNKAMANAYGLDCSSCHELARAYCTELVGASGVLGYLNSKKADLTKFNVIVHLHFYRKRDKSDPGFHKDTRGQTLFFMLHYLSAFAIYGAEWMRERGLRKAGIKESVIGNVVYNSVTNEHGFFTGGDLEKPWEYVQRISPTEVDSVWPRSIRDDVRLEKKDTEPKDDDVHVFRVDAYGAVLVVDDIVHHRTPNAEPRSKWGEMPIGYPQVSHVQARDAEHEQAYYEIERGRSRERGTEGPRGTSRSRSLTNEQKKLKSDSDTRARWEHTFGPEVVRRFFRIWVTVSPDTEEVWY